MMDCEFLNTLGYSEFSRRLHDKMAGQRIPINGSFEVTFRCNLRCQHCYLAPATAAAQPEQELTLSEIRNLFAQMAGAGTLWLLLTGGEPFMRRDFLDIYMAAKRQGMLVTLFTNGTMITPRIADYLAEWKPFSTEITLYGATRETYERVTGVPGSYKRCIRGIELLLERQVPLKLKTMLMTLNRNELEEMQAYADSLQVDFRFDPLLTNDVNGSCQPFPLRLDPAEVVQIDIDDPKRRRDWLSLFNRYGQTLPDPQYLYTCGAGVNGFHIDSYGRMSICMLARKPEYDLRQGSFHQGWEQALRDERYRKLEKESVCQDCDLWMFCGSCAGRARYDDGGQGRRDSYACRIGHLRGVQLKES